MPTPPPTFQPWSTDTVALLKSFSDILAGLASVGLFTLALIGLRQWRKELRGRTELEAARTMVRSILEVRNAFARCRIPVTLPSEFYDRVRSPSETELEAASRDQECAYRKRLDQLSSATAKFDTAAIEAEVLWSAEAAQVRSDIVELHNQLVQAYMTFFPNAQRDARAGRDTHESWVEDERKVLFVTVDDEFGKQAKSVFARSVEVFRPYLLAK